MKAFYRLFYNISILLTGILAGLTIVGAFAGSYSPENYAIMPFIGLVLPILLLINIVSVIYWIIRWRCWVLIPLIAILGNWAYITRVFQVSLTDSASSDSAFVHSDRLTLATYNVNSFNHEHTGYSCKEIAVFMKNQRVDIICFQELGIHNEFGIDSLSVTLAEWPYYYIPSSPTGESLLQLALFSRYPIKKEQLISFPNTNNCSFWCDIDVNGKMIRLFNNHLQTTEVSRNKRNLEKELRTDDTERVERAALSLADGLYQNFKKRATQANYINQLVAASPYPTLVCGDFNSLPSSYTYTTVKGDKLNDGFQTSGHGYMYTFRYFKHLLRIDYIFHSKEIQGEDYFSTDLEYSDHNPVVMRMKI